MFFCQWLLNLDHLPNLKLLLLWHAGEFQGPALLVIFEGACLSREEVTSLQFLPPWRLRGDTLNYGLGLMSSFSVCDVLSVMSGGYYYIFDPRGLVLAPSSHSPGAKVFSLTGKYLWLLCLFHALMLLFNCHHM